MCVCITFGGVAVRVARDAVGEEGVGIAILGGRVTWLRTDWDAGTGAGTSLGREGVTGCRAGMTMGAGVSMAAGVDTTLCRTWTVGGALSAFAFASLSKSFFCSYKSTNLLLLAISVSHPCDEAKKRFNQFLKREGRKRKEKIDGWKAGTEDKRGNR